MKQILIVLALAVTVSLGAAFAQDKAQTPEQKAKAKEVAACEEKRASAASSSCNTAAQKACAEKSGFMKTACEKASKESCVAAAKKSCSA